MTAGGEDDDRGPIPPGSGWRTLREEREREFRIDFAPLRNAIQRNEFLSASVELFLNAVLGVTKMNLGGDVGGARGQRRDGGDAETSERRDARPGDEDVSAGRTLP